MADQRNRLHFIGEQTIAQHAVVCRRPGLCSFRRHNHPNMRRDQKLLLFIVVVITITGGYLALWGIRVETTSDSFAERVGMPLFETRGHSMNVRLNVTPAAWPAEARRIYWAARMNIPVEVHLLNRGRDVTFSISGMSAEHDFIVPCDSQADCARVLEYAGSRLPAELSQRR